MIYPLKNPETLNKDIAINLGLSAAGTKGNKMISLGSSLYIFRNLVPINKQIHENARCNFEKFQHGLLLRINDRQRLYAIPLTANSTKYIIIKRGKERIWPLSLTFLLSQLGMEKKLLRRFWILSRGYYHERFQVQIKTKDVTITIDANDSCFKNEKQYFANSELAEKLAIVE